MRSEPICHQRRCRHFWGIKSPNVADPLLWREDAGFAYCRAFPDGIPDEIEDGHNLHLTPLPGEGNDLVYEEQPQPMTEEEMR
jgi:hypothetical protein